MPRANQRLEETEREHIAQIDLAVSLSPELQADLAPRLQWLQAAWFTCEEIAEAWGWTRHRVRRLFAPGELFVHAWLYGGLRRGGVLKIAKDGIEKARQIVMDETGELVPDVGPTAAMKHKNNLKGAAKSAEVRAKKAAAKRGKTAKE